MDGKLQEIANPLALDAPREDKLNAMTQPLLDWLNSIGQGDVYTQMLVQYALSFTVLALSFGSFYIARHFLLKIIAGMIRHTKTKWDDIILEKKILARLAHLLPPLILYITAPLIFYPYPAFAPYISGIVSLYLIAVGFLVLDSFFNILLEMLRVFVRGTDAKWDDAFFEKKVFNHLARQAPAIVIYILAHMLSLHHPMLFLGYVKIAAMVYIIIVGLVVVEAILSAMIELFRPLEETHRLPIRAILQALKAVSYFVGVMLIISLFSDNAWKILGGLGGLTAVLMLIFKDALLGFVSGILLSVNKMVLVGDWIEMPNFGVDGDVFDITLTTVKVRNFDKTISTIPTYALMSNSFKNWRGMFETGGRRIKRSIYIDMTSIRFCDEAMLDKFSDIQFISAYIERKKKETAAYNATLDLKAKANSMVNGRRLTNIGTFRAYIEAYLRAHPQIYDDMTFIVRQLEPTENGIPIQIYVFCKDTRWAHYEAIQADIFDHILAVAPEFGLRLFQIPSGGDFEQFHGFAANVASKYIEYSKQDESPKKR